jgi:predicted XRE-type DNA-binding protein
VLPAFQTKSTHGIATSRRDIDLVNRRLRARSTTMRSAKGKLNKVSITRSSGNVFADLKLTDAAEKQTKVRLAVTINGILEEKSLRQEEAAKLLRLNQPKISALANYRLEGFSVERLLRFLNALDRDVEIVIRQKRQTKRPGTILVTAA